MLYSTINILIALVSLGLLYTCLVLGDANRRRRRRSQQLPEQDPYPPSTFPDKIHRWIAALFITFFFIACLFPSDSAEQFTDGEDFAASEEMTAAAEEEAVMDTGPSAWNDTVPGAGSTSSAPPEGAIPSESPDFPDDTESPDGTGYPDTGAFPEQTSLTVPPASQDTAAQEPNLTADTAASSPSATAPNESGQPQATEPADGEYWDSPFFFLQDIITSLLLYSPLLILFAFVPNAKTASDKPGRAVLRITGYLLLVYGLSFVYGISGLPELLMEWTQAPELQQISQDVQSITDPLALAGACLSIIIITPICEEICFRGFIFNSLVRDWGMPAAATVSGLLFGAVHLSLLHFIPLSILGIVLAVSYYKSRSIWTPITIHALFNAIGIVTLITTA